MADELTITVRVTPRASKSEVVGMVDGCLKVKIAAPPVDGAANVELIKVLAKHWGVSRTDIEIVGGATSKLKRIRIIGLTAAEAETILKAKT